MRGVAGRNDKLAFSISRESTSKFNVLSINCLLKEGKVNR